MRTQFSSVIESLETALASGSRQKCEAIIEGISKLMAVTSRQYTSEQIALFDDVLLRLVKHVETKSRADLAQRLLKLPKPPPQVSACLSRDQHVQVAGPLLRHLPDLDDLILVDCVENGSQDHLLAVSQRDELSEAVTDVLVQKGEAPVLLSVANNHGARFSEQGMEEIVGKSAYTDGLSLVLATRKDLPSAQVDRLGSLAPGDVREKLQEVLPSDAVEGAKAVPVASDKDAPVVVRKALSFEQAILDVEALKAVGSLDLSCLENYIRSRQPSHSVLVLAELSNMPLSYLEQAFLDSKVEVLLFVSRAIRMSWHGCRGFLALLNDKNGLSRLDMEDARVHFERIKPSAAQDVLVAYRKKAAQER